MVIVIDTKLEECILTLKLIHLKNNIKAIEEVLLKDSVKNFNEILDFLKQNRLIIYIGKNWMDNFSNDWYKLSRKGLNLIGEEE